MRTAILAGLLAALPAPTTAGAGEADFRLTLRFRVEKAGGYEVATRAEAWPARKTAVIVCDMWDAHHCLNAVRREEEMVPRMNDFLTKARDRGALIVHAPSSCMDPYKDHPARKRAEAAPAAKNLPKDIDQWCRKIPSEEKGAYPIDQSDGGEDDVPEDKRPQKHRPIGNRFVPASHGVLGSICDEHDEQHVRHAHRSDIPAEQETDRCHEREIDDSASRNEFPGAYRKLQPIWFHAH